MDPSLYNRAPPSTHHGTGKTDAMTAFSAYEASRCNGPDVRQVDCRRLSQRCSKNDKVALPMRVRDDEGRSALQSRRRLLDILWLVHRNRMAEPGHSSHDGDEAIRDLEGDADTLQQSEAQGIRKVRGARYQGL